MKLVVGLGNPGKEYENTRHNIGYELADMFAKKYNCSFRTERKFEADIFDIKINGEKVIVAKPLTYMKLSGNAVKKIVDFYNINSQDILIMHDDLDMVLVRLRLLIIVLVEDIMGLRVLLRLFRLETMLDLKLEYMEKIE